MLHIEYFNCLILLNLIHNEIVIIICIFLEEFYRQDYNFEIALKHKMDAYLATENLLTYNGEEHEGMIIRQMELNRSKNIFF